MVSKNRTRFFVSRIILFLDCRTGLYYYSRFSACRFLSRRYSYWFESSTLYCCLWTWLNHCLWRLLFDHSWHDRWNLRLLYCRLLLLILFWLLFRLLTCDCFAWRFFLLFINYLKCINFEYNLHFIKDIPLQYLNSSKECHLFYRICGVFYSWK